MHPVVASRGYEQGARVAAIPIDVLVGRIRAQVSPLLGFVRVAVFVHPARAGQQLVVAAHVQQRRLADHRAKQIRPLGQHHAHKQAAVGAALYAEMAGR